MRYMVMSGTSDSTKVIKFLREDKNNYILATTVTDYGSEIAKSAGADEVISKALKEEDFINVIKEKNIRLVDVEKKLKDIENEIKNRFLSSESICSIIKDTYKNKTLTEIQYGVLNEPCRQLILEAPCGEGKTLAALLFSQFFFEKNLIDKIIFVLPTQVTSNNMYNEFKEEYHIPKEFVGIYHSEIMSLLLDEDDMDSNLNFVKYDNLIYAKQFNISTIDHLLLTLINGYKHAPRAFGNLITSTIVIDELHYYDQYTLSLIEKLCEILDILNVPHIIMSATMPTFIKNRFSDKKYKKISSSGYDKNSISKNP